MATPFTRNLISTRLVRAAQGCQAAPLPICHHRSYLLTSRLALSRKLPQSSSSCFHNSAASADADKDGCSVLKENEQVCSRGDACQPCCFMARPRCCALPYLLRRQALLAPSPGIVCCDERCLSTHSRKVTGTTSVDDESDVVLGGERASSSGPCRDNADDVTWRGKIVSWLETVKERFHMSGTPFSTMARNKGRQNAGASISRRNVVSFNEMKRISEEGGKDILIIDVRNPEEFAAGRIPKALLLPLPEMEKAMKLDKGSFEKEFKFPLPDKNQSIILTCKSGKRAETARKIMKRKGYGNLKVYKGSWDEWAEKGAPIEK